MVNWLWLLCQKLLKEFPNILEKDICIEIKTVHNVLKLLFITIIDCIVLMLERFTINCAFSVTFFYKKHFHEYFGKL